MRASLAIENFLEMMSAERGAAQNTLESYRRDLEAAAEELAAKGVNLAEAETGHIRMTLDTMAAQGFAPTSQARRLSALRQFFAFSIRKVSGRTIRPASFMRRKNKSPCPRS